MNHPCPGSHLSADLDGRCQGCGRVASVRLDGNVRAHAVRRPKVRLVTSGEQVSVLELWRQIANGLVRKDGV